MQCIQTMPAMRAKYATLSESYQGLALPWKPGTQQTKNRACGPGSPELSESDSDMASLLSKLFTCTCKCTLTTTSNPNQSIVLCVVAMVCAMPRGARGNSRPLLLSPSSCKTPSCCGPLAHAPMLRCQRSPIRHTRAIQACACQMLYARVHPSRSGVFSDGDGSGRGTRSSNGSRGEVSPKDETPAKSLPMGARAFVAGPWFRLECTNDFFRGLVSGLMVFAAVVCVAAVLGRGQPTALWRRYGPNPFPAAEPND